MASGSLSLSSPPMMVLLSVSSGRVGGDQDFGGPNGEDDRELPRQWSRHRKFRYTRKYPLERPVAHRVLRSRGRPGSTTRRGASRGTSDREGTAHEHRGGRDPWWNTGPETAVPGHPISNGQNTQRGVSRAARFTLVGLLTKMTSPSSSSSIVCGRLRATSCCTFQSAGQAVRATHVAGYDGAIRRRNPTRCRSRPSSR